MCVSPRARLTLRCPPMGGRRDLRKCGGSYTSRPRPSFLFMVPCVVRVGDKMTAMELDSNDFCSVHVFTQPGSFASHREISPESGNAELAPLGHLAPI